ncbi:MAG: molybdopterin-guanine dinucleotide biosynthesis protein B [SAR324 cluster bacterium]|nr:molybdopterin-guanine dinucleotide biosynthesis protein B [SAR324 cluster bacterium]
MFPPVPALVITGFSGSGKTTFLEKLIPALKERSYFPVYIKHAGGKYRLDTPGKDSFRQLAAGAGFSMVFTDEEWAMHQPGPIDETWLCSQAYSDIILLEGFKKSVHPKVLCVHPEKGVPEDLDWTHFNPESNIWAYLTHDSGKAEQLNQKLGQEIAFQRDQIEAITNHVLEKLDQHCRNLFPLNAAVMIGGKSTRMGQDKAWLEYGRGPHASYLFDLLAQQPAIQEVFYSSSPFSSAAPEIPRELILSDQFLNFGPLGGFLTLFEKHPRSAWLVLACDLAMLQKETLDYLIQHRDPLKAGTIFVSEKQRFEPLAAIYEPRMGLHMKRALLNGEYSLQRIFPHLSLQQLSIPDFLRIQLSNVNTPHERRQTLDLLNKENQEPSREAGIQKKNGHV